MRHLESHNVRGAVLLLRYGMGACSATRQCTRACTLAAWLERLETLLEYLETLPSPAAYQFDPRHVPRLVHLQL